MAVVTGAAEGIGRRVAEVLARGLEVGRNPPETTAAGCARCRRTLIISDGGQPWDRSDGVVFAGDDGSRGAVPDQDLIQEPSPPLLSREFTRAQVTAVRHAVIRLAAGSGLAGRRLDDFALAVNELVTNAVRHAGGQGRLRLWRADGSLCCEVTDDGPGIPTDRIEPSAPPPVSAADGRGLWLVGRLCDDVSIATGPAGTTVRIAAALSGQHLAAG